MTPTPFSTLLTFPFKDPAWVKKLLILALVMLISPFIPILPWILATGYLARLVHRMVVEKGEPSLPEWDDLGGIFMDGWRPFAATATYLLPIFAIFFVIWMFMLLPAGLTPLLETPPFRDYGETIRSLLGILIGILGVGGSAVIALVTLGFTFILPAAVVHSVVHQSYPAAFRFGEWLPILGANFSGFIIAYAVSFGINLIFGFVVQVLFITIICCCLTPLLILGFSPYYYLVYAALYGDAYRMGLEKRSQGKPGGVGQPAEPAPAGAPEKAAEAPTDKPADETSAHETVQIEAEAAVKPARKPTRKAKPAEDVTLVQPPRNSVGGDTGESTGEAKKVDTLPLPPPEPVPGVDTVVLPPPASVPGVDTIKLPPEQEGDKPSQPPAAGEEET